MSNPDNNAYIEARIKILGSAFGRRTSPELVSTFQRHLARFSMSVLRKAFDKAESELERFPTPRKLLEVAASLEPSPLWKYTYENIKATDPETGAIVNAKRDPVTGETLIAPVIAPKGANSLQRSSRSLKQNQSRTIRSPNVKALLLEGNYSNGARPQDSSQKEQEFIPRATIHKILRNRIYMGEFKWKEVIYSGSHTPIVSRELWDRVQRALDQRLAKRSRKAKHDFAFSGLVSCGHCGCAFVGEIKKGKYVYYHCTGYKGKCLEPYTREEVLAECFGNVLGQLKMDDEVLKWIREVLQQSHRDKHRFHREAIDRLQVRFKTLEKRIEEMYIDRPDGRIDMAFFDRKAAEWRNEQYGLTREIQRHRESNQTYMTEGVKLLELARKAKEMFLAQPSGEKRRLLDFVVSNSTWKDGGLNVVLRQPFDLMRDMATSVDRQPSTIPFTPTVLEKWLPGLDSN
jgi:hypothetical protein